MGKYDGLIDEVNSAAPVAQSKVGRYDALIDEATDTTPLHNSLYEASGTNPDEEAKKLKLSKELGTPAALLPADAKERAQLQRNPADALAEKAPGTSTFLTKPENAKVTGLDGVDSLVTLEEIHKTYSPENIKQFIKNYTATGKTAAEASQKLSEMKQQGVDLNTLVEDRYARTWGEAGSDVLKVMAAGSNLMAAGAVEAKRLSLQNQLHQLTLSLVSPKAADESRAIDDAIDAQLQSNVKYWQEKKTTAVQELNEKLAKASTADAVMLLAARPALLVDKIALSASYLLPGAGAARGGQTGMLLFNAVTEAMDAANSARQEAIQNGASATEQDQAAGIAALVTAPIAFLGNNCLLYTSRCV